MRGGEVIEMVSDLGGGKTTFVRGLAKGLGVTDAVHSPSFTVTNQYHGAGHNLNHFDFYRLQDPGILRDELAEIMEENDGVTVIEWADIVENVLPSDRLTVRIKPTGETERQIEITAPPEMNYLLNKLT